MLLILSIGGLDNSSSRGELAESERKSLDARTQKLDLELVIDDRLLLPDQLVQPLLGHDALAFRINVNATAGSQRRQQRRPARPRLTTGGDPGRLFRGSRSSPWPPPIDGLLGCALAPPNAYRYAAGSARYAL
jgi:hypothetical protein